MEERPYTVKKEITEDRYAILTVEVDEKEVDRRIMEMAKDLRKKIRVPGYRPGKASTKAIIRYVGKEAMLEELAEKMSGEVFYSIAEEENLMPIGKVSTKVELHPLTFVFRVPLEPEATLKEGYDQVRVEMKAKEISEEDVQAVLKDMQERSAQWVPHEGAVEPGDMITADLVVTADGEELLRQEDWEVVLEEGGVFMPEFVEQVTGMKPGETKTFSLTYPEDAKVPWAGKDATFEVTLHSAKRKELPEIDDEFAREVSEQEDLDSLKADIRKRMTEELRKYEEDSAQNKALDALLEHAEVSYPKEAVEEQIDFILEDEKTRIKRAGWQWDVYLRISGKTEEELRESLRPTAEKVVQERAALLAFAKAEGIEISEEELNEKIEEIAESSSDPDKVREMYTKKDIRYFLEEDLLTQKAADAWFERTIVWAEETPEESESPEAEDAESGKEPEGTETESGEEPEEEEGNPDSEK